MPNPESLTAVPGVLVGHRSDPVAATGCTVILCAGGAVAGIDVRGAAPGSRETDLLRPGSLVERVHAVVLSGGSAFGLDAAGGVMRWLEEQGIGFPTPAGVVPIVPAVVLYDLQLGRADVRPDADWGYAAAQVATAEPVQEGCVGAGTGCSVGKVLGAQRATKSGLGSACERGADGLLVGALVATNALGNVVDPASGRIIAGARRPDDSGFADAEAILKAGRVGGFGGANTTLALVATNAPLSGAQATRVAQMAHDGLARAIRPAHTMYDGDTAIVLSLPAPGLPADVSRVGAMAVQALAAAIVRSVAQATGLAGLPAAAELPFVAGAGW
ncbi:MAG: P1 family peptidase [Chloroflexi bacterium]|nr:P1 family peptidase [Chloroflexota bacterium]